MLPRQCALHKNGYVTSAFLKRGQSMSKEKRGRKEERVTLTDVTDATGEVFLDLLFGAFVQGVLLFRDFFKT